MFQNVPLMFRYLKGMQQKTIEFVPKFVLSIEIIFIWSRRSDSGPNQNNLLSIREIPERYQNILVSIPKLYRNVCPFFFDITLWNSRLYVQNTQRTTERKLELHMSLLGS
jgi:hypothetical protein